MILFWPKNDKKWSKTGFCPFSAISGPKRGSNVVRFKFWDQIWNPLVICSLYDQLLKLSKFDFLVPHCNFKTSYGACGQFFRIRNFRCQAGNQRPKRYQNGWCSHCIAEKMVITTWPNDPVLLFPGFDLSLFFWPCFGQSFPGQSRPVLDLPVLGLSCFCPDTSMTLTDHYPAHL